LNNWHVSVSLLWLALTRMVAQAPDIRQERVQAIRAQIASGTYETSGKLDVAVTRLLDDIG
jgi:negative regulator of flagellin synthesis FlgM